MLLDVTPAGHGLGAVLHVPVEDDAPQEDPPAGERRVWPRPTPSLDRLRDQVRERVRLSTLTHVARKAGVGPVVLRKFLESGSRYPLRSAARQRLFRYVLATALEADEEASRRAEHVEDLVRGIRPAHRLVAIHTIVGALRDGYRESGKVPLWVERLSAAVEALFQPEEEDAGGL